MKKIKNKKKKETDKLNTLTSYTMFYLGKFLNMDFNFLHK